MMKYKKELVLFLGLLALAAALGSWQGQYIAALQYNPDQSRSAFLIFATAVWVTIYLLLKKDIKFFFPFKVVFFLLMIDLFVICFFREDITRSFRNFTSIFLTYGIIFFLSALIHSIKLKRALFLVNSAILVIILTSAFIHATKVAPLTFFAHDNIMNRMGGLFTFAHIGLMAGLNIILSLISLWLEPKKLDYLYHLIQISAMLVVIALTDVRSALLVSLIAGCFVVLLQFKNPKQRVSALLSIAIIVVAGYFAYSTYIASSTSEQTLVQSLKERVEIWKMAVQGIAKRPFSGFGSESYLAGTIEATSNNPNLFDSHSGLLSLALQSGIPATLLFFILYASIFAKAIKSKFKPIIAMGIYWIVIPLFWGEVYLQTIGIIPIVFGVSMIGLLLHGDLYENCYRCQGNQSRRGREIPLH